MTPVPFISHPENMLAARMHLDETDESKGALRVLPGSHRLGRLSQEQIEELRRKSEPIICRASAGDVLLIRPLLLHSSSRSATASHRRVIHIEYAGFQL